MPAVRVYSVRDQLVFGKDGQLVGEQLAERAERGETKRGGSGGEHEPNDQLCIEYLGSRVVADGHDPRE